MRIVGDSKGKLFTVFVAGQDARGDFRPKVRVSSRGFRGANRSVGFDRDDVKAFTSALTKLEQLRQGGGRTSKSPGECRVRIGSVDRLGHLRLEVRVSRYEFLCHETDRLSCRVRSFIDPTDLPSRIADFSDEVSRAEPDS